MTTRRGRAARMSAAAVAVLLVGAHIVAGNALGGFAGSVASTGNAATSGTMLYTETYGSRSCTSVPSSGAITDSITNISCAGSVLPATASGAATTTITANGNLAAGQVTQQVGVSSCAPLDLANTRTAGDPLLVRYGTQFATSGGPMGGTAGAITLDGAAPGGYESGTLSSAQPTSNGSYGLAIWFKTKSTAGGPLFGFGDSAANVAGTNDRILYMTAAGKLGFVYNTAGRNTGVSGTAFNDGAWHLAYVTMQVSFLSLFATATLYVDGVQQASGGGLLDSFSSYRGFWHAGWSPAVGGNPHQYFAGSLSNFTVFDNGSAPTNLTMSTSQSTWDTQVGTATEQWPMNDSGTATADLSAYPTISGSPCAYVDIQWRFTNPVSCASAPASQVSTCTSTQTLAEFAGTSATVASAAPGTSQNSTITLSHDPAWTGSTVSNFLSGLVLRTPVRISMAVGTSAWSTNFTWTSTATEIQL